MNAVRSIIGFATVLSASLVLGVPLIIVGSYGWQALSTTELPLPSIPHSMRGSISDHAPVGAFETMPKASASVARSDAALETGSITPADAPTMAAPKVDATPVRKAIERIVKATAALKRSAPARTNAPPVYSRQTSHRRDGTVLAPSASELALFRREW